MDAPELDAAFRARLRDTLYLDVGRIRSLLAQLRGGIVESIVERRGDQSERRLGARFLGLEAGGQLLDERSIEQTTTLQDALLDIFEEAVNESHLFGNVPFDNHTLWESGELHRRLVPGQLVRLTAPTQIIDAEYVSGEITRAIEVMRLIALFEESQDPTPVPPDPPQAGGKRRRPGNPEDHRQAAIAARMAAAFGFSVEGVVAINAVFEKLLGRGISVRVFPCGTAFRSLALVGRLVGGPGYLRDEHETLFAKYGWEASNWTVVAQVATIPNPADGPDAADPGEPADDIFDRAQLEQMGVALMTTLAEAGFIAAPRFPGLTISPIAIYRDVPLEIAQKPLT